MTSPSLHFIEKFVELFIKFSGLNGKQYLAVHIRAQDKVHEMSKVDWTTLQDVNHLYECISPYIEHPFHLKYAVISSDDCELGKNLAKVISNQLV